MNREIKFRGMSLIVGFCEWRYGFFSTYPKGAHITTPDGECWPVAIESVGQFTGLKDKNGKEIYEGDIVRFEAWEQFHDIMRIIIAVVEYKEYGFAPFIWHTVVEDGWYNYEIENPEVIGNIYENPELLSK